MNFFKQISAVALAVVVLSACGSNQAPNATTGFNNNNPWGWNNNNQTGFQNQGFGPMVQLGNLQFRASSSNQFGGLSAGPFLLTSQTLQAGQQAYFSVQNLRSVLIQQNCPILGGFGQFNNNFPTTRPVSNVIVKFNGQQVGNGFINTQVNAAGTFTIEGTIQGDTNCMSVYQLQAW